MTREERLRDLAACGSPDGLRVEFTQEQREEANKATDEFIAGKNNDGYFVLLRRLESCMASRGYQRISLGYCDGDQEYQPLCMWP